MGSNRDDLASRRHNSKRPAARPALVDLDVASPDDADRVAADASEPEVLDLAAEARDSAATGRDEAAAIRDVVGTDLDEAPQVGLDRMLAARDRAAAALDREEAALDRHRAAEYLLHTYRDELTGALQREAGRDQLSQAVHRARRTDESLVVAFLDVDHLKMVNDGKGHPAGDAMLRKVGRALRHGLRSYDLIVRYGGDEFVCALPDSRLADAARRFADINDSLHGVSFSVGLVELSQDEDLDAVIARADREMYATRRGRAAQLSGSSSQAGIHRRS